MINPAWRTPLFSIALAMLTSCSTAGLQVPNTQPAPIAPTVAESTTPPAGPSAVPATSTPTTAAPMRSPTRVSAPGTYLEADLEIHLRFRSEVDDLTSEEFAAAAMAILTHPTGWSRAGFTFVEDEASDLVVVLAEGNRVDELCLPLETFGTVSCQNGAVVALNADRWRSAWEGWSSTVERYRHYLVTHEVGHLIGLRHPATKCPSGQPAAAAMDPQTRTTLTCPVNAIPLDWEIEWARNRPAVIGPTPDWDGPKPTWPTGG